MHNFILLHTTAILALSGAAHPAITITSLGTAAPPTQYLHPFYGTLPMIHGMDDTSPVFGDVTSAPLAPGKNVLFSSPVSHRQIGSGWATWSHGYTGDVYYTSGASRLTLTFDQKDMNAFYFYVEPNFFGVHPFTITAFDFPDDPQSVTALIEGSAGAQGFLVVGYMHAIRISLNDGQDFAVGEFGWAKLIPAPGALALFGLAGLTRHRRRG